MTKETMNKAFTVGECYTPTHDNLVAVNKKSQEVYLLERPYFEEDAKDLEVYHLTKIGSSAEEIEGQIVGSYQEIFSEKGEEWYIMYFVEGRLKELLSMPSEKVYEFVDFLIRKHWGGIR